MQLHAVKVTKTTSAISILTDALDLLVHIVSPPESWGVQAEDMPELSHLNMVVSRIQTADPSQLDGLLGITATGQRPQGKRIASVFMPILLHEYLNICREGIRKATAH